MAISVLVYTVSTLEINFFDIHPSFLELWLVAVVAARQTSTSVDISKEMFVEWYEQVNWNDPRQAKFLLSQLPESLVEHFGEQLETIGSLERRQLMELLRH